MSRTHYDIARTRCFTVLQNLIAANGVSALTPGLVRKELGDAIA